MTESKDFIANRGNWDNSVDFIFTCLAYCFGFSITILPYVVLSNGGVVALIILLLMLVILGVPLLHFELSIGYLARCGPIKAFSKMTPIFTGIGWAMAAFSALTLFTYTVLGGWSLIYFVASLRPSLDWATDCNFNFNTKACYPLLDDVRCKQEANSKHGYFNSSTQNCSVRELDEYGWSYETSDQQLDPAKEFFLNFVRGGANESNWPPRIPDTLGSPHWASAAATLLMYLLIFFCIWRGAKVLGKLAYIFVIAPVTLLFILTVGMVASGQFEGMATGLQEYFSFDFSKFLALNTYTTLFLRIFYTLGIGYGVYITLGNGLQQEQQFNPRFGFKHLSRSVATVAPVLIVVGIFCFQLLFSFPYVMVTSHLASMKMTTFKEQLRTGFPFIYEIFPTAVSLTSAGGPFWAAVFYLMLFFMSLGTQVFVMWNLVVAISDQFPVLYKPKWAPIFRGCICLVLYLLGIVMCTPGGAKMQQYLDYYAFTIPLIILVLISILAIDYAYGWYNFQGDLALVLGVPNYLSSLSKFFGPAGSYFTATWLGVLPNILMIMVVLLVSTDQLDALKETSIFNMCTATFIMLYPLAITGIFCLVLIIYCKCCKNMPWSTVLQPDAELIASIRQDVQLPRQHQAPGGNDKQCWCLCTYRTSAWVVFILEAICLGLAVLRSFLSFINILSLGSAWAHFVLLVLVAVFVPYTAIILCLYSGLRKANHKLLVPYLVLNSLRLGGIGLLFTFVSKQYYSSQIIMQLVVLCCIVISSAMTAWFMSSIVGVHWEFRQLRNRPVGVEMTTRVVNGPLNVEVDHEQKMHT